MPEQEFKPTQAEGSHKGNHLTRVAGLHKVWVVNYCCTVRVELYTVFHLMVEEGNHCNNYLVDFIRAEALSTASRKVMVAGSFCKSCFLRHIIQDVAIVANSEDYCFWDHAGNINLLTIVEVKEGEGN
jgi:hypothetical protein